MTIDHSRAPIQQLLESAGAIFRGNACRCIFHDDKNASAGLYQKDRAWRYKCQACGVGGDLEDVRKLLGDKPTFATNSKGQPPRMIVCTYQYVAEDGTLLYEKVRYEPKDFRLRKPDGRGGWTWGLGDTRRVLYNLPELIAATPETIVYMVEGEKDVGNLRAEGLVATCNFDGASKDLAKPKWRAEYNEFFRGRTVCIIADKDAAGRAHAQNVAKNLQGIASEVRIVEVPGNACKDASDFISAGADGEAFMALFDTASTWTPPEPLTVGGAEAGEHRKLVMKMASEIQPEKIDYLWPGYLARGVLTVSQGLPGFGKTSTASDIVARLTRGDVAPDGSELAGPADVIFLSAEESAPHIIIPRLIAQGADLSRVCIPSIERDGAEDAFWLSGNVDFLDRIADTLPALRLLVVDPFTAMIRPDYNPNSNEEGRREGTPIVRWAARRNVAVLALNHLAKGGSGHSVLRGLGAGALNQLARCVWQIGADPNNPDVFVLASVKSSLSKKPPSLCFSIGEGQAVTWGGHSEVSADSMLVEDDGRGGSGKVAAAMTWLEDRLASGEQVPAATIRGDAEGAGLDWWAVKEAKGKLGVEAQKQSFSGQWLWTLVAKGR